MTEENKTVENDSVEKTETVQELESIRDGSANLPGDIKIERFGVTMVVTPTEYTRGNKYDYDCKYLALPEPTEENQAELIQFIGPDKLRALLKTELTKVCQAATEAAITAGVFNVEIFVKNLQEFKARGESSTALREQKEECERALSKLTKEHAFEEIMTDPKLQAVFRQLITDQSNAVAMLDSRKRGPREKKAA